MEIGILDSLFTGENSQATNLVNAKKGNGKNEWIHD